MPSLVILAVLSNQDISIQNDTISLYSNSRCTQIVWVLWLFLWNTKICNLKLTLIHFYGKATTWSKIKSSWPSSPIQIGSRVGSLELTRLNSVQYLCQCPHYCEFWVQNCSYIFTMSVAFSFSEILRILPKQSNTLLSHVCVSARHRCDISTFIDNMMV